MPRVLLQAGHSSHHAPNYPGGGGAPGEAEWTTALSILVAQAMRERGVEVNLVGGWLTGGMIQEPPPVVYEDYDLARFYHYDAAIYTPPTGCFSDRYRPDRLPEADRRRRTPNPNAAVEDRFIAAWAADYPSATGIPLHNERRNVNTWDYYAYRATSAATPGVLTEFGCGSLVPVGQYPPGDDADLLHNHIDKVVAAEVWALCAVLDIKPPDPCADLRAKVARAVQLGRELDTYYMPIARRRVIGQELASWG